MTRQGASHPFTASASTLFAQLVETSSLVVSRCRAGSCQRNLALLNRIPTKRAISRHGTMERRREGRSRALRAGGDLDQSRESGIEMGRGRRAGADVYQQGTDHERRFHQCPYRSYLLFVECKRRPVKRNWRHTEVTAIRLRRVGVLEREIRVESHLNQFDEVRWHARVNGERFRLSRLE